jgi:hypothetical protein
MTDYDENYYNRGNYVSYMDRKERYFKLAEELNYLLKALRLDIKPYFDFGCAVGFLMEGFKDIGINYTMGYDVSDWAVNEAKEKGLIVNDRWNPDLNYGVTFMLDVLEHMELGELEDTFDKLKTTSIVFRIPVPLVYGEDYHLECSRNDPTHKIRWPKHMWNSWLKQRGYVVLPLNLNNIYDSLGVFSGIAIKKDYLLPALTPKYELSEAV